jgi:hypothetical protein
MESDLFAILSSSYHAGKFNGVWTVIDATQVGSCVPGLMEREE